jgi:protoporphyrinogen/coproporphyrinogen III oxidase
LRTHTGTVITPTHVISALPLPVFDTIVPSTQAPPHLTTNQSQTVIVFNFVFATARLKRPLHQPGFGYLIPRPQNGYPDTAIVAEKDRKPGMLGVVFDTSSLAAQDFLLSSSSAPESPFSRYTGSAALPFVKMTAMVGGPYGVSNVDDTDSLVSAVRARMAAQLQTDIPAPIVARVGIRRHAIPTYRVGHLDRVRDIRRVCEQDWAGRLKIIGSGIGGVSVGDCLKAGRDVAREILI